MFLIRFGFTFESAESFYVSEWTKNKIINWEEAGHLLVHKWISEFVSNAYSFKKIDPNPSRCII